MFSVLDEIGHGVRSATPRLRQRGTSQSSIQSLNNSVNSATSVGPAPTTKPPTPPAAVRGTGSLSKNSRDYRAPPAVAPPQVIMKCGLYSIDFKILSNGPYKVQINVELRINRILCKYIFKNFAVFHV